MPTRIYLPSTGIPDVTPSTWAFANQANPLTFKAVTQKIGSAMTARAQSTGTTSPNFRAMLRYVIGPLKAQSISGTLKGVMRCRENSTNANATLAIAAKIIQPNGADRAVLLAATASDSATDVYEMATTLNSRRFWNASEVQPIPLTEQNATLGDYLVIEIGFRSATTTSRAITLEYGDSIGSDLAESEGVATQLDPWVEFSGDIQFELPVSTGSMSATEEGADAFAADGAVTAAPAVGTMDATEAGADTASASGTVAWMPVTGTMAATEVGQDQAAASGLVLVSGSLGGSESGVDGFAAVGVLVPFAQGDMEARELGDDALYAEGVVIDAPPIDPGEIGQTVRATARMKVVVSDGRVAVIESPRREKQVQSAPRVKFIRASMREKQVNYEILGA